MPNRFMPEPCNPRPYVIGWDIGGAHLKAVLLNTQGDFISSVQLACPLWRGLNYLETAINDALQAFKIEASSAAHAITMTGELVDLFANRHEGVCKIALFCQQKLGCHEKLGNQARPACAENLDEHVMFYAANSGFVALQQVPHFTENIASTNWHASASLLAMQVKDALLIDIGSTTTDIIAIISGKVQADALSDAARLSKDTLVYTGVVRTPIMALAQKLPFENSEINVAAEYFATMADVYRLTDELNAQFDLAETADGKGKSQLESARRLARMVGQDVHDLNVNNLDRLDDMQNQSLKKWKNLALECRALQITQIKTAVLKHLKPNMTIIGAGAGSFLVKSIAAELNCAYQSITPITQNIDPNHQAAIEVCLPAYAVARLRLQDNGLLENRSLNNQVKA